MGTGYLGFDWYIYNRDHFMRLLYKVFTQLVQVHLLCKKSRFKLQQFSNLKSSRDPKTPWRVEHLG